MASKTPGVFGNFHIERIQTDAELAALRGPWTAMLAEVDKVSVFLTWEWISAWWQHRQEEWPLWLLTAWDEEGELAGVAPLMQSEEQRGPLRVRRLTFLGDRFTTRNHQDFVARKRDAAAVAVAFLAYLRSVQSGQAGWDVLDLEGLAEWAAVRPFLANGSGRLLERQPIRCPYITLPPTWEAYEQQLTANRRQQLRRRRRALERDYPGQVEICQVTQPSEIDPALDELVRLTKQRWHERGLASSFDGDCFVAFSRRFAALAFANGWLRIYLLKVAGQTIAVEYNFLYRGVFSNYKKGFDLAWEKYSPGQIMHAHIIRRAIEEGAREFDMLQGPHEYKYSWTDRDRLDGHPVVGATWRGQAWLLGGALFDAALAAGRRALPPELRQRINVMLAPKRP